jgi:hypothetical protein
MNATPFGFRILGSCTEERRLVDHAGAFLGYASLDPRAAVEREAYLSAFTFGADFREQLESTGSCRGFAGACWSAWLWFDIDRADLDAAMRDARRLALFLIERYSLSDDQLLIFFSGAKGFHFGLPSALWGPEPSTSFHLRCRKLAEGIAGKASVNIDTGVYDRVRAFRAPNSRHSKTGLHKRRLTLDELQGLSLDAVRKLAEKPAPFDLPDAPAKCERARADWGEAAELVRKEGEAKATRTANGNGKPTLNRLTLDFICNGAGEGDRHRLLYSAARNLAEFGCPPALAVALLEGSALDSGLALKEVARQIQCGLSAQTPLLAVEQLPTPSPSPLAHADVQKQLAALWKSPAPPTAVEQVPVEQVEQVPDNVGDVGDAWEPPADQLGAGDGPYSKEGGRR